MVYVSNRFLSAFVFVGFSSGVTCHTEGIMQRDYQKAIRF